MDSELTISINKEFDGTSREISIKMSYDNRKGSVENVWVTELLIDGKQVDVPMHTYAELVAASTTDYTAIARDFVNITRSENTVHDLTTFLVHTTNLPEDQASGIINDLVELAKSRAKEIARLDPKTNAEFKRKEAKETSKDSGKVEPEAKSGTGAEPGPGAEPEDELEPGAEPHVKGKERTAKINNLYDILHNASGKCSIEEIINARYELK
jgi:hypothetical protein